MIEVHMAYELKIDINESTYFEWIKKAIVPALKSDGIIEVRAYRNIKVSRGVLVVGVWKNLEDWITFSLSEGWQSLVNVLQNSFAVNLRIDVWGFSPFLPEPLRPVKQN